VREHRHRICRLADEAAEATDPEKALERLSELRSELDAFERSRAAQALRSGASFGQVAKALGISRQAAHRRYRDLAPGRAERLSLTSGARHAILLAREEAAAAGARFVSSEYLLLGVLRTGGGASRALEAGGITAERARACLPADGGGEARRSGTPKGVARVVLDDAAAIARARSAHYVDADHIALAALNGPDGGALRALTALGVKPATVRERLGC
jgi:hypothetical protein